MPASIDTLVFLRAHLFKLNLLLYRTIPPSLISKRFRTVKRDRRDVSDQENGDPFAKMQDFMRQQFSDFKSYLGNVNYSVQTLTRTVNFNSERSRQLVKCVGDNRKRSLSNISDLQEIVVHKDLRKEIRERIDSKEAAKKEHWTYTRATSALVDRVSHWPEAEREGKYWRARRCLRVWPVKGKNELEIWANTSAFLSNKMGIRNIIMNEEVETIRRVAGTNNGTNECISHEALIVFKTVAIRDQVAKCAKNLGGHIDLSGKPLAGIRLEIPENLMGDFRTLQRYGFYLKKLHGFGLKRNIKYNDEKLGLQMSVRLPNKLEWLTVDPSMAKEESSKIDTSEKEATLVKLSAPEQPASNLRLTNPTTT